MTAPRGLPDRIWVVIRANGERHLVTKEFMEGMAEWAKGTDVTIAEYGFVAITHTPPLKKKTAPKP
jgi:hypothetical protein